MTTTNLSQIAAFIWSVADLLRGDFKQSQYGRVILPFIFLSRLECLLDETKADVLAEHADLRKANLHMRVEEDYLLPLTNGLSFYNTSTFSLKKLSLHNARFNLLSYIDGFSKEVREIFEHFNFHEYVALLDEVNLLEKVVRHFSCVDLSPHNVSRW